MYSSDFVPLRQTINRGKHADRVEIPVALLIPSPPAELFPIYRHFLENCWRLRWRIYGTCSDGMIARSNHIIFWIKEMDFKCILPISYTKNYYV